VSALTATLGSLRSPALPSHAGRPQWARGARLAASMMVPIASGVAVGRGIDGLFVGIGGFVVASTDVGTGYRPRAIALALATCGVASAYLAGARAGHTLWLASGLLGVILFAVGLAQATGTRGAVISTMVAVGFIVGVFLPSTLATDLRSTALIGGGGVWAVLLCLWRWPVHRSEPSPVSAQPRHASAIGALRAAVAATRQPALLAHAACLALVGAVAVWTAQALDPSHGAWLVSSAVLVARPTRDATLKTARLRAIATVAGALAAAVIVAITGSQALLLIIAAATAAVAMAVMPVSYGLGILTITPLSILLTAVLSGGGWGIAVSRIADVVVGVAIAIAIGSLVLRNGEPSHDAAASRSAPARTLDQQFATSPEQR
jgi:Fusaric acid resistance protein-like